MRTATASAPGKVVILGEYAVLEGAPALVMAVDRRVRVSLRANDESYCSVSAPGLTDGRGRFRLDPAGLQWLAGDPGAFRLATHVIESRLRAGSNDAAPQPFELLLDSTALMERRRGQALKLGLGSSAALTVALCQALSYYVATQHEAVATPGLEQLIEIHSGFQGRRGSGLDVAASLHGGLVEYYRSPSPRAVAAALPRDMAYCFVWTGCQAATSRFLASIEQWRRADEQAYRRALETLGTLASTGAQAARDDDADGFLACLDEYVGALEALGRGSGTDILSAPHRDLRSLAGRYGIVYKPCGAGGGDIGIGLSRDPAALAGFRRDLVAGGFEPLSLNCERAGVEARSGN